MGSRGKMGMTRTTTRMSILLVLVLNCAERVCEMKCALQSRDVTKPGWWNLYPLMRTLDAAPYKMEDNINHYTYLFNICDNTKKCLNGAMAACHLAGTNEYDMGMEHWGQLTPMTFIDMKHANTEIGKAFDTANPTGVKLTYHNGAQGRKTHILFPCDPTAGSGKPVNPVSNQVENPPKVYTIVFPSKYGCLQKNAPQIPQILLGSEALKAATNAAQAGECGATVWTHLWAVTTIFSLVAATYFWWKSSMLQKELDEFVPDTFKPTAPGGKGVAHVAQPVSAGSYQNPPAQVKTVPTKIANVDYKPEDTLDPSTTTASAWPPPSRD